MRIPILQCQIIIWREIQVHFNRTINTKAVQIWPGLLFFRMSAGLKHNSTMLTFLYTVLALQCIWFSFRVTCGFQQQSILLTDSSTKIAPLPWPLLKRSRQVKITRGQIWTVTRERQRLPPYLMKNIGWHLCRMWTAIIVKDNDSFRPGVPKRCVARDHEVCREIKKYIFKFKLILILIKNWTND
jgi:hypothetical protein